MNKICTKCKKEQDISCFNNKKSSKDGHDSICKSCQHEYDEKRKEQRREYCKQKNKEYYQLHKEEAKVKQKQYYQQNKEHYREYDRIRNKTPERIQYTKEKNKRWFQEHPNWQKEYNERRKGRHIINYQRNRETIIKNLREKRANNPQLRLSENISSGIYHAIKQNKAGRHWETLVPYTFEELKSHLEKQFTPEMNWDNYGTYWEIDHIIPKNLFNYESEQDEQFQICWSLMNLRPLSSRINQSRPKDGSDISEEVKNKILGQNIKCGII